MQCLSFLSVSSTVSWHTEEEGKKTPKKQQQQKKHPTFCNSSILPTKESGVLQTASYTI